MLICSGVFLPSCSNYLDVNIDPNQSTTANFTNQLTAGQYYIGNALGNDRTYLITSIWSQYYTGGPGVSIGDWDQQDMDPADANLLWRNMYRAMSNLDFVNKISGEEVYQGMSKILMAYCYQILVDMHGDIPFSKALKGDIPDGYIINPSYDDDQSVVYPGIVKLLQEGKTNLSGKGTKPVEEDPTRNIDNKDDVLFNGHLDLWERFANSLLLKVAIRSGDVTLLNSLDLTPANFLTDEYVKIPYPGGSQGSNPWWTIAKSTALGNYMVGTTTSIDYLKNTNDPRLDKYYDPTPKQGQLGMKPGDVEAWPTSAEFSRPQGAKAKDGGIMFSPTNPVILMSPTEVNFYLAEANILMNNLDDAETFYKDAVTFNFDNLGIAAEADAYLNSSGKFDKTDATKAMKSLAIQKWLCFNGTQPVEAWIETRRLDNGTNGPFTSPGGLFKTVSHPNNAFFPSIWFYPESEMSLNPNAPAQVALNGKVFWDK